MESARLLMNDDDLNDVSDREMHLNSQLWIGCNLTVVEFKARAPETEKWKAPSPALRTLSRCSLKVFTHFTIFKKGTMLTHAFLGELRHKYWDCSRKDFAPPPQNPTKLIIRLLYVANLCGRHRFFCVRALFSDFKEGGPQSLF